jgi:hypothetical protein
MDEKAEGDGQREPHRSATGAMAGLAGKQQ